MKRFIDVGRIDLFDATQSHRAKSKMKLNFIVNVLAIWVLLLSNAFAYDERLKQRLQATVQHTGFNGVVLVSKGGQLLLNEKIGFADSDRTIQLTDGHMFSTGSVGKEFSTVAIMQLVNKGLLNYSDKVSQYVDFLPSQASDVTIEHIMTHTAGFPKIQWQRNIDTAQVVEQIKSSELQFEPGTGY